MILAVGIDSVDIQRFERWAQIPDQQRTRIFSAQEIAYCLSTPVKMAERFAARFAAKEAFYKAISTLLPNHKLPLFTVCTHVSVATLPNGAPFLTINWDYFRELAPGTLTTEITAHLSLTHTASTATAIVLLSTRALVAKSAC